MEIDSDNITSPGAESDDVAYLVVRDGTKWRDVFRLVSGQVTTLGRATTNRIVVRDEVCSRKHCEVFQAESKWTVRDLDSRNGTRVDGVHVAGDYKLADGQLIQIGNCDLGFTFDLSHSFPQFEEFEELESETDTEHGEGVFDHPSVEPEPEIIHRRKKTRYNHASTGVPVGPDRTSRELADLYRLALDMGATKGARPLAEVVLNGLLQGSCADIGAILLLPKGATGEVQPGQLRVVAYKSAEDLPYQKVSDYLSGIVLSEWEAVLARDIADDSRLASRDSLGQIHAKSVICAPIRAGQVIHGLLHLYSTNPDNPLEPDDLEFALAVADQLAVALGNLKERESLAEGLALVRDENQTLRRQLAIESELIGDSPAMQQLRDVISRIAPTDATALIRGESGVGKELVARAMHFGSNRKNSPFVCMNCAALSESLLESELFGHEKGSFTGATGRKPGKFEQADRGTLFLDEVGEMSLGIQAKFLRVLEGHPFERVGGSEPINVDVRVVAATNRQLEQAVEEGTFRKDLYFRLYVAEIRVEPLRNHRTDIPVLAEYFRDRFARKAGRPVSGFTGEALELLLSYVWPGNVRELQNTIERAVILCTGKLIRDKDIELSRLSADREAVDSDLGSPSYREISLGELEQQHILATLEATDWNKSRASQILGIERSTLDRKLKRYRVARPSR